MWGKVSPLRKQHNGRDQAFNQQPSDQMHYSLQRHTSTSLRGTQAQKGQSCFGRQHNQEGNIYLRPFANYSSKNKLVFSW